MLEFNDEFVSVAKRHLDHLPKLSNATPEQTLSDFLSSSKFASQARRIGEYIDLKPGLKALEVGSGYGVTLASFVRLTGIDAYGVEPKELTQFPGGVTASKILLRANQIDESRIREGVGESLPYENEVFDLVYSLNVLEHTSSPVDVLREALRVLKPGGILFFEFPNFFSFFEGHYNILTFPIFSKRMFRALVRFVYRRDDVFLDHLHTEINPMWLKRRLNQLRSEIKFEVLSLGEEEFRVRSSDRVTFEQDQSKRKLERAADLVVKMNKVLPISSLFIATRTYYPIYLVLRKT